VLVAHLLLMASPLHDARMGTGPDDPAAAFQVSVSQPEAVALDAASHRERDGHCLIEWTTASQGPTSVTPHLVAVVNDNSGAQLQLASPPLARAIGPPADGDPQAVLQVFRL
jgi:hypothetical protein